MQKLLANQKPVRIITARPGYTSLDFNDPKVDKIRAAIQTTADDGSTIYIDLRTGKNIIPGRNSHVLTICSSTVIEYNDGEKYLIELGKDAYVVCRPGEFVFHPERVVQCRVTD